MAIFTTILVGGIGAAITYYFQERSWKNQEKVREKEAELTAANQVFKDLSTAMDTRLYSMRRVAEVITPAPDKDDKVEEEWWQKYQKILEEWNFNLNRNLCMVQQYFSKRMSDILEFNIQGDDYHLGGFRELHFLLKDYYDDVEKRKDKKEFQEKFYKIANNLSERIRNFNLKMISSIQHGEVGIFNPDVK